MKTGFYYHSDEKGERILFIFDEGNPWEAWYSSTTNELSSVMMWPSGIGICQFESAIPISEQSAHALLQSWHKNMIDKIDMEYEMSKKRLEEKWGWSEVVFNKGKSFQGIHLR